MARRPSAARRDANCSPCTAIIVAQLQIVLNNPPEYNRARAGEVRFGPARLKDDSAFSGET